MRNRGMLLTGSIALPEFKLIFPSLISLTLTKDSTILGIQINIKESDKSLRGFVLSLTF